MEKLARLVDVYTMLAPYIKTLVAENAERGIPVQRPLFLHNEDDQRCYEIQYQYLLGADMLVAPVYLSEQTEWEVYLPQGNWIHLWTGEPFEKGVHTVAAPMGNPPVFYKSDSQYAPLFEEINRKHGTVGK